METSTYNMRFSLLEVAKAKPAAVKYGRRRRTRFTCICCRRCSLNQVFPLIQEGVDRLCSRELLVAVLLFFRSAFVKDFVKTEGKSNEKKKLFVLENVLAFLTK